MSNVSPFFCTQSLTTMPIICFITCISHKLQAKERCTVLSIGSTLLFGKDDANESSTKRFRRRASCEAKELFNLEEPIRQIHNALSLVVFIRLQVTEWSESWRKAMRELLKGKPQAADVVSISCAKHKSGRYPHSGISFPACSNHSTADMVSTICAKEAHGRRN